MREGGAAPVHDALAVAYLIDPTVVTIQRAHVRVGVETASRLSHARTVMDLDGITGAAPNAHVALVADARRFFDLVCATFAQSQPGQRGT